MTWPIAGIMENFQIAGRFSGAAPHGSGHINQSFRVRFRDGDASGCYLLQRLNTAVFPDAAALMDNLERVTSHLHGKLAGRNDALRRVLTPVPTGEGRLWHGTSDGSCWRTFLFIEGVHSFDRVSSPAQAFQAAKAFGGFQHSLADLPLPPLHETIADFHNTPKRLLALEAAIAADASNRCAGAAAEIGFVLQNRTLCDVLLQAKLPVRVTHNDTKLNNVLFDDATGEALCVVDLDTVMPGLALYDFGDMVRTATSPTEEDELDLSRVTLRMPFFQALVEGYLESTSSFLTAAELQHLPQAGVLLAFEQAIRFLADHLSGDVYYKVSQPNGNLHRCRTQLKLVQSILQQQEEMHSLVESVVRGTLPRVKGA